MKKIVWRQRVVAILGVVIALTMIAAAVFWLYTSAREKDDWKSFVIDSVPKLSSAETQVTNSLYRINRARDIGVAEDFTKAYGEQIDTTREALVEASELSQYVEDAEDPADRSSLSPLGRDLDPIAGLEVGDKERIALPVDPQTEHRHYREVFAELDAETTALKAMDDEALEYIEYIEGSSEYAWNEANDALEKELGTAWGVLQRLGQLYLSPDDAALLWDTYERAQQVRLKALGETSEDQAIRDEIEAEMRSVTIELREAFAPYVEWFTEIDATADAPEIATPPEAGDPDDYYVVDPGVEDNGESYVPLNPYVPPVDGVGGEVTDNPELAPDPEPAPRPTQEPGPSADPVEPPVDPTSLPPAANSGD